MPNGVARLDQGPIESHLVRVLNGRTEGVTFLWSKKSNIIKNLQSNKHNGSRLKTRGYEKCIGAATLDRIMFRTLHQFLAKAMPSCGRGHRKRSDV
jgi:hypothetical protein